MLIEMNYYFDMTNNKGIYANRQILTIIDLTKKSEVTMSHYHHRTPLIHFDRSKMTLKETWIHYYRRMKRLARHRFDGIELAKGPRPIKRHHHFLDQPVQIHFNRKKLHPITIH